MKRAPGVRFTKVFRTKFGHKCILVECSVIALCLPVMSKISIINACAINITMIGMSIKRISVLNLCHSGAVTTDLIISSVQVANVIS